MMGYALGGTNRLRRSVLTKIVGGMRIGLWKNSKGFCLEIVNEGLDCGNRRLWIMLWNY